MKKVNSLFNEKQRYSIRKYHIGAASIIIGSVVFMNTGSLSYASEVDNKASEIVENEIHTNKERISNIDTAVQEKEDNKANSTIENQNNNPENQKSELKKEVSLVTELPISAPLLEKGNSKNDTQEKEVNKADKQLNDQINSGESPKQVIQENKDNQVEEHSNKNNNQIKDSKTGEVSNYHETELINKEDNLKVDGTDDTNKVVISQNENRQKVRRKRNVVNPSNDNNLTNDDYNKNANQMNTDVSSDGTMTYQWYPVIGGLSSQERFLITNGYGDNENRARKKATMLWLISNFDFTKEQRQSFKIQDLNSPLFGDDVYKWLEEAKKGNIIPKQGTMNLGRRNEMIISANNIILSDNKGFDRGIINFGDTRNFTPSDSDDVNNTTITSSDIDFGFTLKPPFEKIGVDNTWAVSDNEKEEIKSAIRKANSNINFVNINVSYNGTVFAQALNSSGEIVDSADLNANTVIIDKIFIEKKEKLDTLISLVENTKLLDESLYTPASINFLQRELDYTSIVIRDSYDPEINTIPDIISATNRLDYAIKSLVRRANVTELQNAISNAKNQGPFDNNIEEDQAIILALEVGENTVGNENTPQDVVDTVTTNINNALRERLQVKNLLQDVETLVNEAEEKNRNASNMVVTALTDGIFSNNENNTLTELVNSANNKKAEAQDKINLLPDSKKAPFQNRIDSLPTISIPEVNDADGNGIADDVDQAKARAENKVTEAEAADQAAKTKLTEYQQDGLITASEKADLENLATTAQSKKTEAQGLVDALPDGLKNDLVTRLNNLTGIQVPEVNDADGNGIADDEDQAKAQAESKVSEAEAADQAAKTKLTEYQQDGLITASEKADLDNLVTTAQSKKTEAQGLVDALPDGLKNDLATRLNNLTGIQVPAVNDADGNGIADDVDQAKAQAESKVSEAEAADQAAKTKLTEYQQDGLITASEKADLDSLAATAQSKKAEAQGLVDALPDGLKNDLVTRLNNLTGIQVPAVNDADGNGIADDVDQAKAQAESKVTEAEASYQAAKVKLSEYQQDGLITLTEREEIEELIVLAEKVKREAQKLVDALAESDKGDLSKRLDNLVYIQLPLINDADGNGIADDIDSEILKAENSVINAEVADKTVKDKLTEYQQDGLVSSNEKRELINLLTKAQRAKAEAQVLVDALSSEFRGDLPSRLNKLTGIEIPKVNDADNDGKKDDVDELKALVETKVQEAEAAHQNALAKLSEYQRDGLINQWEKNDILNLSHEVFSKKARAFALVDGLPKEQQDEFLNRLNKLTDLPIPEINDKNNNGIADDVDETKAQAESKVSEAEAANQAAKTKLTEYQQDGLITASEKADLDSLAATAQSKKTEAQGLVDALPDVLKGDLPTRLNNLTGIQVPEVNDADGNGIVDDKDRAQAESKVTEAEAADQVAKTKLSEYQEDGLITEPEKVALENLAATAQTAKTEAQGLVDALPDGLKNDLVTRLNNLTGIQVPEVNDADGNGIADNVDQAKARAENKVTEAEAADQATKTKLTEYQQDGLITASEKADLENLLVTAQSKKAEAQGLVDALPDVLKGDMATRLNNLTGIQVPEVNDADGNGIADDVDQAKARAENKVIEAESIDQTAKAKLVEYQEDGLIIEPEKVDLENLSAMAQSKKAEAQRLVDALPDVLKGDLPTRLNNLTGIQVPEVNDADGNGIADDVDQAKAQAESKVTEAEAADQAAKVKLSEYQQDGLITAPEKTDLENLAAMAQSKKTEAQRLVDALPDVLKGDLSTRLNNLTGIQVPAVNDADGNGIADDIDQAKAQAESKVTEAEAADQAAKTKLSEYQQDGLITASEKADLEKLAAIAQSKKAEAQKLVDAIPNDVKEALQNRLNRLEGIVVPSVSVNSNNGQSNSHNMQGKDDINKNKDTLQKSPALSSNPQKTLNSKADTSNDASNDMKGTHMSTANNESTNTTKLNINSDNTKRGKSNNVKVLSPSKVDEKIDAKTLPNTGEEATKDTTLFGALLASIGSLIVWRSRKKENTKETK
ncbi:YSIRK-type signal peptide-containing protein [Staphylococcus xylosus]|uniref:GA-like domain-containing protein n=1 Tax=Staphylococcus xylosus TaxID=1288 RepID=UPI000E698DF3|nr:YSIRK-type signal peptide-containing protein [Staphylococcus xylosus]RIM93820.1 YSIRK-type signal peptide-containing protein [Staphylococcus xylosus]